MKTRWFTVLSASVFAVLAGCATDRGVELSPGPTAETVPGLEGAAVDTSAGFSVIAQSNEWPGEPDITTEVTPIRVSIENSSNHPIRVRYSDFALVDPNGARYAAIPPLQIDEDVETPVTIENPYFLYDNFRVAPYYSRWYPYLTPYDAFYYDPFYYDRYSTVWIETQLPTPEMLAWALPEGVVLPGGSVTGYLYFEDVDDDWPQVTFTGDLVDADSGETIGDVSIPFTVED